MSELTDTTEHQLARIVEDLTEVVARDDLNDLGHRARVVDALRGVTAELDRLAATRADRHE